MQVTLQLQGKEADILTHLARMERQTPRRKAQRLLADAIARQAEQTPKTEV